MSETIELIRGDDAILRFELSGEDDRPLDPSWIASAVFTADGVAGTITAPGVVDTTDGTVVVVDLTHDLTAVAGVRRADLQLTSADRRVVTPWLGTLHIIEDVTP